MPKVKRESKREPGVNEITQIAHQAGEDAKRAKQVQMQQQAKPKTHIGRIAQQQ